MSDKDEEKPHGMTRGDADRLRREAADRGEEWAIRQPRELAEIREQREREGNPADPAVINRRARAFWDEASARFNERIASRPVEAAIAADRFKRHLDRGVEMKQIPSFEQEVFDQQADERIRQKSKAQKPRLRNANPISNFMSDVLHINRNISAKDMEARIRNEAGTGNAGASIELIENESAVEALDANGRRIGYLKLSGVATKLSALKKKIQS